MSSHPCNDFADSGEKLTAGDLNKPICRNCRWTDYTHHAWERHSQHGEPLGPHWYCKRCGRSAYDKDGRCTPDSLPSDYPPCSTWQSDTETD